LCCCWSSAADHDHHHDHHADHQRDDHGGDQFDRVKVPAIVGSALSLSSFGSRAGVLPHHPGIFVLEDVAVIHAPRLTARGADRLGTRRKLCSDRCPMIGC
jgi:hypothetical protein